MGHVTKPPRTVVIILNWNGWKDTLECLNSLHQAGIPNETADILVIDNCSTDDSVNNLTGETGIELIQLPVNLGFAGGNNIGIRKALAAGCDSILLLNNDTIVQPGFLDPLLDMLASDERIGAVCPKILYHNPPDRIWYAGGRFRFPRIIGEMIGLDETDSGQYNLPRTVDFGVGCCILLSRQVLDQVGLLDDQFFSYEEDVDFSYRIHQAGFQVWYQPQSVIYHKVSRSTSQKLPYRAYLQAKSRTRFFRKHIHGYRIALVFILETIRALRFLVRRMVKGEISIAKSYLRGLKDGLGKVST